MKKLMALAVFTLFAGTAFAADMAYLDEQFGCIDSTLANKYIADMKINTRSFGGVELCKNEIDTKKLLNDMQIIEQGTFQNAGSNNLIRGFVALNTYYPWLKSQTRGMNRGNDVPYATAYNSMGYFTMQDGWAKMSTLGRVGTVLHEARHTAGYRHYRCNQGPYYQASVDGCDADYQTGGSHSVEMEYYARVSVQGTNFHPVYRSMARLMAMARANFVFNQPVLKSREGLLVMTSAGSPVLFDGSTVFGIKRYDREAPAVAAGTHWMKRTSFGAVLFDGLHALAIEMYKVTGSAPALADSYSYFKLLERDTKTVRDLEEVDLGIKRYVVKVDDDSKVATFNFPSGDFNAGRAVGFDVARTATVLPNGQKGLFLVGTDGRIVPFDPERQQTQPALAFSWDKSFVNVASWNSQTLMVSRDSHVYQLANGQWQPWTNAQDLSATDIVSVPLYDAFDVTP